ncbi:MAG: ABC transporter permease [Patescibacteria group bacterium]
MNFRHSVKTAYSGISANKGRSILTLLGIVIGIASIMMIISIGRGTEELILNQINSMGADTVVIRPGQEPTGPSDIAGTIFADSLKERDIEALKKSQNVPHLIDIAPIVIVTGSVSYESETYRPQIFGWSMEFMAKMFKVYPQEGYFFDESDIKNKSSVAVIGSEVKKELFGESNAVGKYIKIRERKFRVIGVIAPRGQVAFLDPDKVVVVPYSTAQTYLLGIDYYNEVMTKVDSPEFMERTVEDIKATLREQHNITDSKKDDFFIVTQKGLVSQIETIIAALTLFLSSVVAISLVVGGIGVMNIMLVSVTERTREIGLRKALGATKKDILFQFLIEAVMLTAIGGIIGIISGALLSFIAAYILKEFMMLDWVFSFPIFAALLGFGVSAFVGLIFGIYPARKASNKSPMEALRYE